MKDCRDVEPLKAPYVDGDAVPADRTAVDTHLTHCGRCRDDVAVERAAHDVLQARRDELRPVAPESLKQRCAAACRNARAASSLPRAPLYRRWVPMSVAATLLLAVVGVFAFGLTEKAQALAFQMTIDHVKCSRFAAAATHVDSAVEGQRWAATYGWDLKVAASAPDQSLRLRGVRRCAVTDGRVAHLLYEWQGRPLSVYVLPSDVVHGAADVRQLGHEAVMWTEHGRTYVVLARGKPRPELDGVVRYVKANVY
jgi:anti-sigma factor RsiW